MLYHGDAITDYGGNTGMGTTDGVIVITNSATAGRIRIVNIMDGTSNTLLVGERRVNLTSMLGSSDTYDNEPCLRPASDCDTLRRAQAVGGSWLTPAKDVQDANTNFFGGSSLCQFGSSHPNGMNALLCDGHVRRIGYGVDPATFRDLCLLCSRSRCAKRSSVEPGGARRRAMRKKAAAVAGRRSTR
jgi:prepilin-type processing-associated H-X9-DG protein